MQDYIDAQYGGPGKGLYRIVTNPFQARKVINAGQARGGHGHRDQRAVRLHLQGTCPSGDVPACDAPQIDQQLDEVHKLGVRADGAGQQVRQRAGRRRRRRRRRSAPLVNAANFLETGSFWDMRHCPSRRTARRHDNDQLGRARDASTPSSRTRCSARSASSSALQPPVALPLYRAAAALQQARPDRRSASTRSRGMAKRHMIFDPDHMSVKARNAALDLIEKLQLPRRRLQPLVVDPRRLPADLQGWAASSRRTPATPPASSRSGSSTCGGRTRATTSASATART